ncbi:Ribosomal protein l20, partial [Globisporangium splendens]
MSWSKHKKILAMAKGYRGRANSCYRTAINRVEKGLQYQYRDRKQKKRDMRSLWIQKINAGARQEGLTYSKLFGELNGSGIELNRKVLADLAATEPYSFKSVLEIVKHFSPAASPLKQLFRDDDEEDADADGQDNKTPKQENQIKMTPHASIPPARLFLTS